MLKEIDLAGALKRIEEGSDQICMLIPMEGTTTVSQLTKAKGFVLITKQAPEKKEDLKPKVLKKKAPPKVDHGKIIALHKAGWNVPAIAFELGCSDQTVYNHLAQEENNGAD